MISLSLFIDPKMYLFNIDVFNIGFSVYEIIIFVLNKTLVSFFQ